MSGDDPGAISIRHNNFDLLRLIAAAQVAVFHAASHLHVPLDRSQFWVRVFENMPGVPLFFVVSGFLISSSWERNPHLAGYARNRVLRIYPALWVCLGVSIATAAWFGGVDFARAESIPWLLAQLSIGQFYNPDFLRGYGMGVLNGSLWTIPVELQFYAFVPLLYGVLRLRERAGTWALLAIAVVSAVAQAIYIEMGGLESERIGLKLFNVSLIPHLWMFMIGVLLQRHFIRLAPWLRGRTHWWLGLFALAVLSEDAIGWRVGSNAPHPIPMLVLSALAMSCAYSAPGTADRLLRGNDVSYGLYIYHAVFLNAFIASGISGTWTSLTAVLAVSLAVAALSWVLVERPALRRKKDAARPVGERQ